MPEGGVPANESLVASDRRQDGVVKSPSGRKKIACAGANHHFASWRVMREYQTRRVDSGVGTTAPQLRRARARLATITTVIIRHQKGGWAAGYGMRNKIMRATPGRRCRITGKSHSVMNWVQAADDASKVTPDIWAERCR